MDLGNFAKSKKFHGKPLNFLVERVNICCLLEVPGEAISAIRFERLDLEVQNWKFRTGSSAKLLATMPHTASINCHTDSAKSISADGDLFL